MMAALGFKPIKAAALAVLGNTAAVPFGALAIPIVTLSHVTGLGEGELGAMVGRQTPLLALIVPFILIGMVDGRCGLRQAWPVALVGGLAFAAAQFTCSNHISVELTDIVASIASLAAIAALLRVWAPAEPLVAEPALRGTTARDSPLEVVRAFAPYLVILAVFSTAQLPAVKRALAGPPWTTSFQWPGLDVRTTDGAALLSLTFHLDWLPSAGTLMLISGLITMVAIGLSPGRALRVGGATLIQLRGAALVVTAVLALAYVVNQSGQTLTLGLWAAGAGPFFAFLAPALGWLGVAVTGSDTASNALFGGVQVAAANHTGIAPTLLAAANASGGVRRSASAASKRAMS
jgi:lactate permease